MRSFTGFSPGFNKMYRVSSSGLMAMDLIRVVFFYFSRAVCGFYRYIFFAGLGERMEATVALPKMAPAS